VKRSTLLALVLGLNPIGALVSSGDLHNWLTVGGSLLTTVIAGFGAFIGLTKAVEMVGLWLAVVLLVSGLLPFYLMVRMEGFGPAAIAFTPWGVGIAAAAVYLNTTTISMDHAWEVGAIGLWIVLTSSGK
jgi:hypothetical protein